MRDRRPQRHVNNASYEPRRGDASRLQCQWALTLYFGLAWQSVIIWSRHYICDWWSRRVFCVVNWKDAMCIAGERATPNAYLQTAHRKCNLIEIIDETQRKYNMQLMVRRRKRHTNYELHWSLLFAAWKKFFGARIFPLIFMNRNLICWAESTLTAATECELWNVFIFWFERFCLIGIGVWGLTFGWRQVEW